MLKLEQVKKELEAAKLGPQRDTTGSWAQFRAAFGVGGAKSLCNTNRPSAGNTRPDPGTMASCHTFHTLTIKIPERIRSQLYIQSYTLSCSFPPSTCQRSHLSIAPTLSLSTSGAPPPTHWYRRRHLRPQCRHHPDGEEWYTVFWVSATTLGQRCAARSSPKKGQSIREEHLEVSGIVNHKGLPTDTRASVSTRNETRKEWIYFWYSQVITSK